MLKKFTLIMMMGCFTATLIHAQIDDKKMSELKKAEKKDVKQGWTSGGSFGLALDQLASLIQK